MTDVPVWKHPLYATWKGIRARCLNPNATGYERYGGRGISICDRWMRFEDFCDDVPVRPSPYHSLDRVDVNKGYEPGNVRWATREEQQRNRRDGVYLTIDRRTFLARALAEEHGMRAETIIARAWRWCRVCQRKWNRFRST